MALENPDEAKNDIDKSKNASIKGTLKMTRSHSPTYGSSPQPPGISSMHINIKEKKTGDTCIG